MRVRTRDKEPVPFGELLVGDVFRLIAMPRDDIHLVLQGNDGEKNAARLLDGCCCRFAEWLRVIPVKGVFVEDDE